MRKHFVLWMALLVVITLWVIGGFYLPAVASTSPTEYGTFGDKFGAVNSLFSGLAFAILIYALRLQSQELELQRIELRMTRKELERSAAAHQEAARALEQQLRVAALTTRLSAISALLNACNERIAQDQSTDRHLAQMGSPMAGLSNGASIIYKERKQHEATLKGIIEELNNIESRQTA